MARRSRSSTSSASRSTSDSSRQASPQRLAVAGRAGVLDGSAPRPVSPSRPAVSRRTPRPRRAAPRGTSTSRRCGRPRTGRRRRSATRSVSPLRPERGVLELGRPAVGAEAELRVELDLAVGHLEDRAEHAEEPAEAGVVAGHRVRASEVEHEVVGEDPGEGVVVLAEDGVGHREDDPDVRVVGGHGHGCLRGGRGCPGRPYEATGAPAHRANRGSSSPGASAVLLMPTGTRFSASPDASPAALRTVEAKDRRPQETGMQTAPHRPRRRDRAGAQRTPRRCVPHAAEATDVLADDVFLDGHPRVAVPAPRPR